MTSFVADVLQQAVAAALEQIGPVDGMLRRFFRQHAALGRRDRALIAETVFDVLRNRRLYGSLAQSGAGRLERRLALISVARRDRPSLAAAAGRFGSGEAEWVDRISAIDPAGLEDGVRLSLPDWLLQRLVDEQGRADALAIGAALLAPAPLDLRVNITKADRQQALAALQASGIEAQELPLVPTALRVQGKPALENSPPFQQGWVEVQDAGSQVLACLVAPRRGQTVIDFCAGAGGKTLAIAALMRSTGQVFACDVSLARLQRLRPRLARAGLTNVQPFAIDHEGDPKLTRLAGKADLVLVDAPCSGTGTLRRNPDLKWRIERRDLDELQAKQTAILAAAARLVKPGGALVYATCSLFAQENEVVCQVFEDRHPQWQSEPAAAVLARQGVNIEPALDSMRLKLRPDLHGCDGFFAARWIRRQET